jgi:transformation/transcription domain-associated protein
MEWFIHVLFEVNQHVFQEVWTQKIEFFFDTAQSQPRDQSWLLQICQGLLAREATSPTLLAIALRFLVDRMPLLGGYNDQQAGTMLKMYKIAFQSVTLFPATNEVILASYLPNLIMDCFPLASKSSRPTHYWHLMRILFRSIGAGGAKLERLFNQVVSLLPEMLECLNRHLHLSESLARDMIAELCLSVPLRLTPLLPHLAYLMQPLVHALTGGQELVQQGLRTLELCIDNLTPQFLDPTLNIVLRELSEALYGHLVPVPGNHHIAHTTIRILGKLGGRNRKLLNKELALKYRHYSEPAKVPVSFGGNTGWIDMRPMSVLAAKIMLKTKGQHRNHAYAYLESCLTFIVQEV